jgi:hypothetical protein
MAERKDHHMRMTRIVQLVMLLTVALTLHAGAQSGDQMGFTTYYFTDSGENSVVTTSFNLAKKLLAQTVFLIDIELDNVTVPPVTAVTGATRPQRRKSEPFEKSRGQVIVGIDQGFGPTTSVAGNFYRSQEVDYTSTSAILTISQDLNARNTTLVLRGQYNNDQVGKILESGELVTQKKRVFTGAVTLTQLLSPTTVLDLSYDLMHQKGFLSDPYRQVTVYDHLGQRFTTDELHPDFRARNAVTGRLSQLFPAVKASFIGSYRYYFDSWKVKSSTMELRLNKYIIDDLIFGVDYRYYIQKQASFYQDRYVGLEYQAGAYRTADYKLRSFNSNNFGFSLTWLMKGLGKKFPNLDFLQNSSIEIMYFRYFNTLDFTADIIQAGLKFSI